MKQYKMASISNPTFIKQPLKFIKVPLEKFSEEVIPHHQRILEQHKVFIQRLIAANDVRQLTKEVKDKKRTIKQLRDLLYELDTLRTQVQDNDLDAFDTHTMPLRSNILKLTKAYQDLEKNINKILVKSLPSEETSPDERINPFEGASYVQIQDDINNLKLKEAQARLVTVEEIQRKAEDLEEIHRDLHSMVKEQGDQVNQVEENVASSQDHVHVGFRDIVRSHKLNAVAYPATGAFVGTLIAGPIGLLAGLKVGGLAALGCAFAGYAGGKFLKRQKEIDMNEADHVVNNENNENQTTVTENEKKVI